MSELDDRTASGPDSDPAAHYDRITPAWSIILGDDFHHGLFDDPGSDLRAATERMSEAMADLAGLVPGASLLDVGCGTGAQACWLAARHPGIEVLGISTSTVGVDAARRRSEAAGLAEVVRFAPADARRTGLPAGSFDVVWSLESSQYVVPREELMQECARLLAPGGRLVLADVMLARPLGLRDLRRLHADLDILRYVFGDAVMGTTEEYQVTIANAGLEIIEDLDLTERVVPTFAAWRARARDRWGDLAGLMGEGWPERFVAGCDAMERFFVQGIVRYGLIGARRGAS